MPTSKTAPPTGSGLHVAKRPRSSGGEGPPRPLVAAARSPWKSSFRGIIPPAHVLFSRKLCSRHLRHEVLLAACPQPAGERRPGGLRRQRPDRRSGDQDGLEPRCGSTGECHHRRSSLLHDRRRRQGEPARHDGRQAALLARGVRFTDLSGPPRPLCLLTDSGPLAATCSSETESPTVEPVSTDCFVRTASIRGLSPRTCPEFPSDSRVPWLFHEMPLTDGREPADPRRPEQAVRTRGLQGQWPPQSGGLPRGPARKPRVETPPHGRGRPACGSAFTRRLRAMTEVACNLGTAPDADDGMTVGTWRRPLLGPSEIEVFHTRQDGFTP
jgi:hypothetical protein